MTATFLPAVTADSAAPTVPFLFEMPDEMLIFIAVVIFFVLPAVVFAIVAGVMTSKKDKARSAADADTDERQSP